MVGAGAVDGLHGAAAQSAQPGRGGGPGPRRGTGRGAAGRSRTGGPVPAVPVPVPVRPPRGAVAALGARAGCGAERVVRERARADRPYARPGRHVRQHDVAGLRALAGPARRRRRAVRRGARAPGQRGGPGRVRRPTLRAHAHPGRIRAARHRGVHRADRRGRARHRDRRGAAGGLSGARAGGDHLRYAGVRPPRIRRRLVRRGRDLGVGRSARDGADVRGRHHRLRRDLDRGRYAESPRDRRVQRPDVHHARPDGAGTRRRVAVGARATERGGVGGASFASPTPPPVLSPRQPRAGFP